jgi:hypothetical protein
MQQSPVTGGTQAQGGSGTEAAGAPASAATR